MAFQKNPDPLPHHLKFEYFSVESGLSNNIITDVVQDSLGYIWIATNDGLNRYNGNTFLNFKTENESENKLVYNFIEQLKLNDQGELYIVTGAGLNIYNPKTESFRLYDTSNGLIGNGLSCMEFGKNEELIFGIYEVGLQIFDPKNPEKRILLNFNENDDNTISSNRISDIQLQGKNTLWVSTYDNGLNKIDYATKSVRRVPFGDRDDYGLKSINCMYLDNKDNLWLGTKSGIMVFTSDNERIHIPAGNDQNRELSDNEVLAFEVDDSGKMWVGIRNGGLNIVDLEAYRNDAESDAIQWFLPNQNGTSVYNRTVSCLTKDKENNMWIGTSLGLNYVNPRGNPLIRIRHESNSGSQTVSHDRIRTLTERFNGDIWIGTDGGGLDLYNPKKGSYKHFRHDDSDPRSLSNNYTISLLEDSKKRVWIGTYQGGLNLLDTITGNTRKYLQGNVEDGSDVRVIFEDSKNRIWAGTNRGGLYRYNETTDKFDYIESLGKMDIRDIAEDENKLWMATYGDGLLHFDPETNDYNTIEAATVPEMPSNIVHTIKILSDHSILAGTAYGGLVRWYPKTETLRTFTDRNGLSNNTINSMVFRNEHEVWLGTFKGISYYNTLNDTIKNLNSYSLIATSDFNSGAAMLTRDSTLYMGGNAGLYIIQPEKIFNSNSDYSLLFENLKLFNNKVDVANGDKEAILQESLPFQDHVILNHDQTLISVDFSVLKYPNAGNIKYSYLLEDYQDHWVNLNNSNSINLNKLPPGEYRLIVKGAINPEKTVTNSMLITILPPFWKTLPAYLLYFIVALGLTILGMRYYSDRLKLKNSLLFEKKQRQLENELNLERVRFFTGFSHELKTPLSLIMAPIEELIEQTDNKKHKDQLKMVHRNSKYLYQNIKKLLEFRKAETGLNQLSIEKTDITDYITQLFNSYETIAKSRGISLKLHKPEQQLYIWCDIEKVEIIIHNLLSNAFKHTDRNGTISLSLAKKDNILSISVSDTGNGIPEEDLPHIFDWYYQSTSSNRKKGTGIGLALSKVFAELHQGSIIVQSKFHEGAKFTLNIPTDAFRERTQQSEPETPVEKKISEIYSETSDSWNMEELSVIDPDNELRIGEDKEREVLLLIDDNADILQFLGGMLETEYDLIFAANGKEGVQKARKYVPDLIVSDVMMPEKSGMDLCKELKEDKITSHIPIILLTAKANTEGINQGYEEGADDYITKPFNPKILKTRIKNLIQNRIGLRKYFTTESDGLPEDPDKHISILDSEKEFLRQFQELIERLIPEGDTNIETLCSEMGMSRTSLFRKIKALTGGNINDYVRKIRLQKAVYLIRYEKYTISQASYEVGFKSVKYFRKIFKEAYGKLPSEIE
ncbi:hybrid sensor histidine kinase/response regulator transcription factor [Robertkochia solimangrovi]|uniref:hybrid sensor histidine kinase/response regulator transcription factor n=1 Tax=Robertkochia solimangrovi TaxID=2213046 RepID=UPI0013A5B942|nr:hybrid sensor histidine kinase/response regulator transcription factor [Robertkochia solimangrovi]